MKSRSSCVPAQAHERDVGFGKTLATPRKVLDTRLPFSTALSNTMTLPELLLLADLDHGFHLTHSEARNNMC